jgi:acyl-CoA dehydrogenase
MTKKGRSDFKLYVELSETLEEGLPSGLTDTQRTDCLLQKLREANLLTAISPYDAGGLGLSTKEIVTIIFNVSKVSGSVGLIYSMHLSQLLCLIHHSKESTYLNEQLKTITKNQQLIASATSEIVANGDIFGSHCTIVQAGSSLSLSKETPNISYANLAEVFLITALENTGKKPRQRLILSEAENTHLTSIRENKMMGMKGIVNHAYQVEATFSKEALFDEPFAVIARDTMTPATHLFWAALWSGIAANAITKAKNYIRREMKSADTQVKHEMDIKLSEMVNSHYIMNALIRDALSIWSQDDSSALGFSAAAVFNRLKVICSESVNRICYEALSICGLRGYAEGGPYSLSEQIRDAMSAPIMVSNFRLIHNTAAIEQFINETP